jgi:hypothetical protein
VYNAVSKDEQSSKTSPFNGTIGIGHGTLANRPDTCTHTTPPADDGGGVMYWATDQGSWNSSSSNTWGIQFSGADGVLYRCSATDTWVEYYTPAPYPNIWSAEDAAASPTASSPVVIARIIRCIEVASIITGLGWHFRKSLMAVCLAALSLGGTLLQIAPKSYDTLKVVSRDSAVKVLTVFNHLTKPRD